MLGDTALQSKEWHNSDPQTYQGASTPAGGADWYVAVPGSPVCTAQISIKAPAMEETAKKIALSLKQAK
jgi:hypothetical protein